MPTTKRIALALVLLVTVLANLGAGTDLGAGTEEGADWNQAVGWRDYEAGIQEIERTAKPGLLVFYTDWCPHCTTYSKVFHDPRVVGLAQQFVMIRVNRDEEAAINDQYAKGGSYVPRTHFLGENGAVDWEMKGANDEYPYFLSTGSPEPLLGLMKRMLEARKG